MTTAPLVQVQETELDDKEESEAISDLEAMADQIVAKLKITNPNAPPTGQSVLTVGQQSEQELSEQELSPKSSKYK